MPPTAARARSVVNARSILPAIGERIVVKTRSSCRRSSAALLWSTSATACARRPGIVIGLLAGRLCLHQRCDPPDLDLRTPENRLRPLQGSGRHLPFGCEGGGLDLEEGLAGRDIAPLPKQLPADNAADLRP